MSLQRLFMNTSEKGTLHECSFSNHVLIYLIDYGVTDIDEGYLSPPDEENTGKLIVTRLSDVEFLYRYCNINGEKVKHLMDNESIAYVSVFIEPADLTIKYFLLNRIKDEHPAFWSFWVNNDIDDIIISFPKYAINRRNIK